MACRELIQRDARVCPHCRCSQMPEHWRRLGTGLKWVAGATAIISLLIGTNQINRLFDDWRGRQEAVAETVKAAQMQTEAGDYRGAWKLYQEALQLQPGSRPAREGQVELAMVWLRNIRTTGNQTFSELVDPLLPVLYRAAANRKGSEAADALAHIGWANYLKNRDTGLADAELWGPRVDEEFSRALAIDPANTFAHAMSGFWILYRHRQGGLSEANRHFSEALKNPKERQYVQKLRIAALLNSEDPDAGAELIRVADEMRRNHEVMQPDERQRIVENVYLENFSLEQAERNLGAIPPADHLKTMAWLIEGIRTDLDNSYYRFYRARLSESLGDRSAALAEYRKVRADPVLLPSVAQDVTGRIDRLSSGVGGQPR